MLSDRVAFSSPILSGPLEGSDLSDLTHSCRREPKSKSLERLVLVSLVTKAAHSMAGTKKAWASAQTSGRWPAISTLLLLALLLVLLWPGDDGDGTRFS